ncbi:MAG: GNAT family N-acetyltransferase [Anaerolineales bacterium]|nr:GNAT family N-acetyltransferase [Anaerolineales bacterium]
MIYGERIRFRGAERTDLPTFVRWFNDPEVRENLLLYLPMSLASEEQWFESMIKRPPYEQVLCCEVKKDDGWFLIGNCGFASVDLRSRNAEIGISIGEKDYWDQGYGTEMMQLMIRHGFETLNLNRIMLRVYDTNPRARHVYGKVGFMMEGTLRQEIYKNGEYIDVHIMAILREEWDRMNDR